MSAPTQLPNLPPAAPLPLRRTWLRNALGLLVLAAIVGGLLAIDRWTRSAELGPLDDRRPKVGQPAPDFALRTPDGATLRLSDYRGRVVWLNFWATWCIPCREELPDIQRLADEFADDGLVVLAINYQEPADVATAFWEDLGLHLPALLDREGAVVRQYRLRGFPDNFFIDRAGVLRSFKLGFLDEEEMRERLAELGLDS